MIMSQEAQKTIEEFFQKVMNDAALEEQIKTAVTLPEAEAMERIAQIASDRGYAFTASDLLTISKGSANHLTVIEDGDMTDQQLDPVTGGYDSYRCQTLKSPRPLIDGDFYLACSEKFW